MIAAFQIKNLRTFLFLAAVSLLFDGMSMLHAQQASAQRTQNSGGEAEQTSINDVIDLASIGGQLVVRKDAIEAGADSAIVKVRVSRPTVLQARLHTAADALDVELINQSGWPVGHGRRDAGNSVAVGAVVMDGLYRLRVRKTEATADQRVAFEVTVRWSQSGPQGGNAESATENQRNAAAANAPAQPDDVSGPDDTLPGPTAGRSSSGGGNIINAGSRGGGGSGGGGGGAGGASGGGRSGGSSSTESGSGSTSASGDGPSTGGIRSGGSGKNGSPDDSLGSVIREAGNDNDSGGSSGGNAGGSGDTSGSDGLDIVEGGNDSGTLESSPPDAGASDGTDTIAGGGERNDDDETNGPELPEGFDALWDRSHIDQYGWTRLYPENAKRIIYVSSSEGSDRNNGLTRDNPLKTLEAGYESLRNGRADWLLLKTGDTWDRSDHRRLNWVKGGRSKQAPMVLSTYGAGPRPVLLDGKIGNTHVDNPKSTPGIRHLRVVGLHLKNDPSNKKRRPGIGWMAKSQDVLFEDVKIRGGKNTGIGLHGGEPQTLTNIRIRRCIVVDSYNTDGHSQGLYATGVEGLLIEQNTFDHNGWNPEVDGAEPTIFNHNIYIQRDNRQVVIDGNVIARGSSHGFQLRPGGVASNNLLLRNALAGFGSGDGGEKGMPDPAWLINNVVIGGTDIGDKPRGSGLSVHPNPDGRAAYNILIDRVSSDNEAALKFSNDSGPGEASIQVHHNVVRNWCKNDGRGLIVSEGNPRVVTTSKNIINGRYRKNGNAAAQSAPRYTLSAYLRRHDIADNWRGYLQRLRQRVRGHWPEPVMPSQMNPAFRAALMPAGWNLPGR
jgi:hypothetical protein